MVHENWVVELQFTFRTPEKGKYNQVSPVDTMNVPSNLEDAI
jgi:hypothetical protein